MKLHEIASGKKLFVLLQGSAVYDEETWDEDDEDQEGESEMEEVHKSFILALEFPTEEAAAKFYVDYQNAEDNGEGDLHDDSPRDIQDIVNGSILTGGIEGLWGDDGPVSQSEIPKETDDLTVAEYLADSFKFTGMDNPIESMIDDDDPRAAELKAKIEARRKKK